MKRAATIRNLRTMTAAVALLVVCQTVSAQVRVQASVDMPVATVGDHLRYTVSVSGTVRSPNIQLPDFGDAFQVYGRPSTSSRFQMGTGGTSRSVTYTYTLLPLKEGTHSIGAARVRVDGKDYSTQPLNVRVVAEGQTDDDVPSQILAKLEVDRTEVYVNEPVTVTFSCLWAPTVSVRGSLQYKPPESEGFLVESLSKGEAAAVRIGPTRYTGQKVRHAYIPLRSGDLVIGSTTISGTRITKPKNVQTSRNDLFRGFFGPQGKASVFTRRTEPVTIHVKPLPEDGRPVSFTGGVGSYHFEVLTPPATATVGDSVILTAQVKGGGYIQGVGPPELPEASEYKLYEPETALNANGPAGTGGEKEFTYVLVPQREGVMTIPELSFSYFEPERERYITHRRGPFSLQVAPAPDAAPVTIVSMDEGSGKQEIKVIGEDIFMVAGHVDKFKRRRPPSRVAAGLVVIVPPVAYAIMLVFVKRRERLRTDTAYVRHLNALRNARRRLLAAEQAMGADDDVTFYQEVHRGVAEYLADKLDEPAAGITVEDAAALLQSAEIDHELTSQITDVLEVCDYGRFGSSGHGEKEQKELLKTAAVSVKELEKVLKNRRVPEGSAS